MMKNSVLYPITNRYRMALSLDGMWQFQFDPKSCGLSENWKDGLPSPISMPVPASFSDFGVTAAEIESLTEQALTVKRLLNNNMKTLNAEDVRSIYKEVIR